METKQRSRVQSSALQTELIATQKPTLKALQVNVALIFSPLHIMSSCAFSASSALTWLQGDTNDCF